MAQRSKHRKSEYWQIYVHLLAFSTYVTDSLFTALVFGTSFL